MLYRRIAGNEHAAVVPPARLVDTDVAAGACKVPPQVWIGYTLYYSPDVNEIPLIHRCVSPVVPIIGF